MRRLPLLCLAALVAVFFPACIKVEQDIWIHDDGSGRMLMKMGVSKAMLEMAASMGDGEENPLDVKEIEEEMKNDPNVKSYTIREEEDDTHEYIIIDAQVKDVTKLEDPGAALGEEMGGGGGGGDEPDMAITKTPDGNYKLSMPLADAADPEAAAGAAMFAQMLEGSGITVRVHADPVSHNGEVVDGAVVWEYSMTDILTGKAKNIEGVFKPGAPAGWLFWAVFGGVIAAAAAAFVVVRSQAPKPTFG